MTVYKIVFCDASSNYACSTFGGFNYVVMHINNDHGLGNMYILYEMISICKKLAALLRKTLQKEKKL